MLLTRVMLPFLPLVSFAAVAMGMLNAHERFGTPAFAPAVFNVVAIALGRGAVGAGLRRRAGGDRLGGGHAARRRGAVPHPGARRCVREGWRLPAGVGARRSRHPRAIARLMAPGHRGPGRGAGQHLREHASSRRTSRARSSWLQYAFRILYLPIGIFGVAVGTVATTGLARRAAAGDLDGHARDAGAARCACWPS